ncbi:MAG: alpha/beta hydrolase [Ilumatobacteraceae bacterium]
MTTDGATDQPPVMLGAEAWSHTSVDASAAGALVLHGFTGNPSSVRGLAEALAGAGFDVELPRLPGHGTTVEDMQSTCWADWTGEVGRAYERLAERASSIVIAGLSMGGSLTLWCGLQHPEAVGLICVNPATEPPADDVQAMLREMLDDGTEVIPGIGSDIADPDAHEIAYEGTPIRPLLSMIDDGLAPLSQQYGELHQPLLVFTSRQDHTVEPAQSDYLAAHYGGPVDHRWLERSYHVATQDFDRDIIDVAAVDFARKVTAAS